MPKQLAKEPKTHEGAGGGRRRTPAQDTKSRSPSPSDSPERGQGGRRGRGGGWQPADSFGEQEPSQQEDPLQPNSGPPPAFPRPPLVLKESLALSAKTPEVKWQQQQQTHQKEQQQQRLAAENAKRTEARQPEREERVLAEAERVEKASEHQHEAEQRAREFEQEREKEQHLRQQILELERQRLEQQQLEEQQLKEQHQREQEELKREREEIKKQRQEQKAAAAAAEQERYKRSQEELRVLYEQQQREKHQQQRDKNKLDKSQSTGLTTAPLPAYDNKQGLGTQAAPWAGWASPPPAPIGRQTAASLTEAEKQGLVDGKPPVPAPFEGLATKPQGQSRQQVERPLDSHAVGAHGTRPKKSEQQLLREREAQKQQLLKAREQQRLQQQAKGPPLPTQQQPQQPPQPHGPPQVGHHQRPRGQPGQWPAKEVGADASLVDSRASVVLGDGTEAMVRCMRKGHGALECPVCLQVFHSPVTPVGADCKCTFCEGCFANLVQFGGRCVKCKRGLPSDVSHCKRNDEVALAVEAFKTSGGEEAELATLMTGLKGKPRQARYRMLDVTELRLDPKPLASGAYGQVISTHLALLLFSTASS